MIYNNLLTLWGGDGSDHEQKFPQIQFLSLQVKLNFLMVGHTHEAVDQMFNK